jgi:hypothetical protein
MILWIKQLRRLPKAKVMAKAPKWNYFHAKVDPKKNRYNLFEKTFRHLGTLDSVQVQDELNFSPAYDEPVEDYIASIRKRAEGLTDATITQSSYVQEEDGYDSYSEVEAVIKGWRSDLTDAETKAVEEYYRECFERGSL